MASQATRRNLYSSKKETFNIFQNEKLNMIFKKEWNLPKHLKDIHLDKKQI